MKNKNLARQNQAQVQDQGLGPILNFQLLACIARMPYNLAWANLISKYKWKEKTKKIVN